MKIVTAVVNNVDYIEIQYYTLKKYFKGDYEFIVFNDAKDFPDLTNNGDISIKYNIIELCKNLNIKCINIPNDNHKINKDPAIRCADSMNYILDYQKKNPDKYLILDSDMFLIDNFDINKYSNYDCAIVLQNRNDSINYIWNGIYYFDMFKIKNNNMLNWNISPHCDVGGMMQYWLKEQFVNVYIPTVNELRWSDKNIIFHTNNIYFIKHLWSLSWDETELPKNLKDKNLIEFLKNDHRNIGDKFFCEIYDDVFFHYRAGGNWRNEDYNLYKKSTLQLKNILLLK